MKTVKKLKEKLAKWLMKDCPIMQPIEPIVIKPESLKRFHSQRIVPHWEFQHTNVDPDYFVRMFKYDVMQNFMDEVIIKVEEEPEGIRYSVDLLFKNV